MVLFVYIVIFKITKKGAAGASRSATITIGYVMHSKGMSYDEAHDFVKEKRGMINPNFGFVDQLKKYFEKN